MMLHVAIVISISGDLNWMTNVVAQIKRMKIKRKMVVTLLTNPLQN